MTDEERALRDAAAAEVAAEKNKLKQDALEMWASVKDEVLADIKADAMKPERKDPYQAIVDKYNDRRGGR